MAIITELGELVHQLADGGALRGEAESLPAAMDDLDSERLLELMHTAAAVGMLVERVKVVGAGIIARRSVREAGYSGLAATKGHRNAAALVQAISGGTRSEAEREVRLGAAVMDAVAPVAAAVEAASPEAELEGASEAVQPGASPAAPQMPAVRAPWDAGLCAALLSGALPAAKHDAIVRGLGAPPVHEGHEDTAEAVAEAWSIAAEQLIGEAADATAEDLVHRARAVRDALDPIGAEQRFATRYERRSFRTWTDREGQNHAHLVLDDEGAAWVRSLVDAALRPRRGGPRFVAEDENKAASDLVADPRTNEQLGYDLVLDVLRAGSLAKADDVFGKRQPGVRMVVVKDGVGPRDALDLGREQRLFSSRQNIAMAMRDGGCLINGCSAPASYCEGHHIDEWLAHEGRTDIDRGVLLCRFHHMWVHAKGFRIVREGKGAFVLLPPKGANGTGGSSEPIILRSKSAVRWAWNPPPPPDRPGWRTPPDVEREDQRRAPSSVPAR